MAERQVKGGYQITVPERDDVMPPQVPTTNLWGREEFGGVVWCSLPELDPRRMDLINSMAEAEGTTADNWIGKEFTAEHCIISRWEGIDEESGEVKSGPKCTLISPSGEILSFAGKGAIGCIQRLMGEKYIGLPPWPQGVTMLVGTAGPKLRRRHTLTISKHETQRLIGLYQARTKQTAR